MTHGIYAAGGAMLRLEMGQDVTANNLANAATTGFRRDLLYAREAAAGETARTQGPLSLGVVQTLASRETGPIEPTGAPGDLAVSGDGYFVVQAGDKTYITRAGSFQKNAEGELVDATGARLLGEGGPIGIDGDTFDVNRSGEVIANGSLVDTIRLVAPNPSVPLRKAGEGRFEMPDGSALGKPEDASVLQGYLEGSNVNAVREMISLVESFRAYEANSKSIRTADETLDRAVNQVGRVG